MKQQSSTGTITSQKMKTRVNHPVPQGALNGLEEQSLHKGPSGLLSRQPSELLSRSSTSHLSRSHQRVNDSHTIIHRIPHVSQLPSLNFTHVPASVQRTPKRPQNQLPATPVSTLAPSTSLFPQTSTSGHVIHRKPTKAVIKSSGKKRRP